MTRHLIGPVVASAVTFCVGCGSGQSTDNPAPDVPEALYFEVIGSGRAGSLSDTTEVVFRDSASWADVSTKLRPRAPFMPVDFSQYMVALVALPELSGGFRVEFQSVETAGDSILASYVVFEPGTDCMTATALTLPFQAVAIRRSEEAVAFTRSISRESCSL